jgi:flagellar protein FlaJ
MVANKAKASNVKSLLLRFSNTIATGESEHDFIREESRIEGGRYTNEYSRSVENLKKWTDAYAAMLVSVTLIVVVSLVSTLLGALESSFVVMVGFTMVAITSGGVYIILRTAPYEKVTYDGDTKGPPDRARARFFLRTVVPVGAVAGLMAALLFGVGYGLLLFGFFLFPTGFFAGRDHKKVRAIDDEVSTFVRSLGSVAGATRSTISSALSQLNLGSMGTLEPHVTRLRTRLLSQLPAHLSWERFKTETGNELLRRATEMVVDGVEAGARGEEVGEIASAYATRISELRQLRALTASSFSFLIIPMHVAMTGLLLFILSIVTTFDLRLRELAGAVAEAGETAGPGGSAMPGMDLFAGQDVGLITVMITVVILVLTIANGLVPQFAAGGSSLKIAQSLGIASVLSGANMIVVPIVAGGLLTG